MDHFIGAMKCSLSTQEERPVEAKLEYPDRGGFYGVEEKRKNPRVYRRERTEEPEF